MSDTLYFVKRHRRRMTVAWLVLLASLVLTISVWWRVCGYVERSAVIMRQLGSYSSNSPASAGNPALTSKALADQIDAEATLPWLALASGLGISVLLFGLLLSRSRRQRDAEVANEALQQRDEEIRKLNSDFEQRLIVRTQQLSTLNEDLSRFKAVTEATSDFINITDMDGRVLYLNQAGRRMTGISPDEEATRFIIKDFAPPWVMEKFKNEGFPVAFRDGIWKSEVALLHRDGHEIPVSFVGLVIRSERGEPKYLACVARDVSEEREMTEKLKHALAHERELNVLKSNFISMVSHEIRTPLALILSSSEILARYLDRLVPEKRQRHLETINEAVHRMSQLVGDVLMFSRAETGRLEFKPAPMNLNAFCARLAEEVEATTRCRCPIRLALLPSSQLLRIDEALTRHILTNLLNNAVKYSPPGSPVSMDVQAVGDRVIFRILDRGIGIPEADMKRLFTPFYRSRNAAHVTGTGLGLVIVKRCAERHGGAIHIDSREGEGTTVTVDLQVYLSGDTDHFTKPLPTNGLFAP